MSGMEHHTGDGRVSAPGDPESGIGEYITRMAEQKGIVYRKTPGDAWADSITRLAGDEVEFDQVESLLLALERAAVLKPDEAIQLHVRYLREKLHV